MDSSSTFLISIKLTLWSSIDGAPWRGGSTWPHFVMKRTTFGRYERGTRIRGYSSERKESDWEGKRGWRKWRLWRCMDSNFVTQRLRLRLVTSNKLRNKISNVNSSIFSYTDYIINYILDPTKRTVEKLFVGQAAANGSPGLIPSPMLVVVHAKTLNCDTKDAVSRHFLPLFLPSRPKRFTRSRPLSYFPHKP